MPAGQEEGVLDAMRLDGRVALVTGGSQGLGLGIALALAEAGASVAIAARSADRLEQAAAEIERRGAAAYPLRADLSDLGAVKEVVASTCDRFGRLDILVTSAAAQLRKPALEVTPQEWDALVAINLRSVFFLCQEAARRMLDRPPEVNRGVRGKIINLASLTAVGAWPDVSVYGMTKGGVVQLTRAMALEWAPLGICVNALGPGTFHTELTDPLYTDPGRSARIVERIPLGRPGVPRDLAGAVVFLASSASDYVTGQVLWVDGGYLVLGGGL
jgi:NAD(P)-dependent dehydrogenase (short-subunit alcohol dehydrogenase family)